MRTASVISRRAELRSEIPGLGAQIRCNGVTLTLVHIKSDAIVASHTWEGPLAEAKAAARSAIAGVTADRVQILDEVSALVAYYPRKLSLRVPAR